MRNKWSKLRQRAQPSAIALRLPSLAPPAGSVIGSFGVRAFLPVVCLVLLAACGKTPDPAFMSQSGDLAAFVVHAISNQAPFLGASNPIASIQATWHSRVLTGRHKSGEYLDDRQALQVATATTNFGRLELLLTQALGSPTVPLREETGNWRQVGWALPAQGLGVWLVETENECKLVVTHKVNGN